MIPTIKEQELESSFVSQFDTICNKAKFQKKLGPGASLNFLYACFDTNAQIQLLYSVEDVEKKLDNNYIRPDAIGLDFTIDH